MSDLKKLKKGDVVMMKRESGMLGYGNAQCVQEVCAELGTISLYGHNQRYKDYHVAKVLPSAGPWIPVSPETMPNERKDYFVLLNSTKPDVGQWVDWGGKIGWNWAGAYHLKSVTHYQPIAPIDEIPE